MTPESTVASTIQAMGAVHNPETLKATYALFKPLQERAPKSGVRRYHDLAYGDDERQRLDIVTPESPGAGAPVVVYLHGGGLVGGERSPMPGLMYENVATFFARAGCIGVNATYRLAPAHQWPSGAQDVGQIVNWLQENVAQYGGDPSKIVLIGQSAGASHAATWTFRQDVHGPAGPRVAGLVLLSGVFSIQHPEWSPGEPSKNQQAYYGSDATAWEGMSTLRGIRKGHPPVMVCLSEFDPYPFAWSSIALAGELLKCDQQMSSVRTFSGHNHVSTAMSINSDYGTVGPELLAFVDRVTCHTHQGVGQ